MDAKQHFKLANVFNVKDKVALVTGGGSGIGLMATLSLAVNGAKVYITGRTVEKLNNVVETYSKDIAGEIVPIPTDMSKKESLEELAKELSSREDHLNILINNAGINSEKVITNHDNAEDLSKTLFHNPHANFEDWENVYRTNTAQPFFTSAALLPLLQKGSDKDPGFSSTIINITSVSGLVKISQHHFAYNASKAASIHLTKMLAHEVTSSGLNIRVNNIAPGVFPSEMTARTADGKPKSEIPKEKYEKTVPAARPGSEEDMASTVIFTACNQYMTGQTIVVDGGFVMKAGML